VNDKQLATAIDTLAKLSQNKQVVVLPGGYIVQLTIRQRNAWREHCRYLKSYLLWRLAKAEYDQNINVGDVNRLTRNLIAAENVMYDESKEWCESNEAD
jgi:hypothetical protein